MRNARYTLAALVLACCCVVGACGGDDTPTAAASDDTSAAAPEAPAATSEDGAAPAQLPATGGAIDCAAVKEALAKIIINWQVTIGLTNTASTEWASIPLGTIAEFGDQLATVTAALGSDADAAAALAFMSGANDIIEQGVGGDAAAQENLKAYMGTDTGANLAKQQKISVAYQNAGCK